MIDNLGAVLDKAAAYFARSRTGTIVVDAPGILDRYRAQVIDRAVGMWRLVGASMGAWSTWRTGGHATVHLGCLPDIDQSRTSLFRLDHDPRAIAYRLWWYHQHTRAPWHMTAGVSGVSAIRATHTRPGKDEQPFWGVGARRPWGDDRRARGDISWERPPAGAERELGWVLVYDLNAARLAAANVADLPWPQLAHVGPQPFDAELGGYWLVPRAHLPRVHPMAPPLVPITSDREVWLTTPIMQEMNRAGINPEILDSWTAPCQRWLLTWAKTQAQARLRAIETGDEYLLRAVKDTYKMAMGMLDREGGSAFLPIVAHTVIDRQAVTVINHIKRAWSLSKRWPVKVATDALYYASPTSDANLLAERLGLPTQAHRLGHFRHFNTIPMAEWLDGRRR